MQNNLDDFYIVSLRPVYACLHRIANIRGNGIIKCHFLAAGNFLFVILFLLPLSAVSRHITECQCGLSIIRLYLIIECQRLCTHRVKFNKSIIFIIYVLFQNSLTVFGCRCCCNSGCNRRFCCSNWCFCCGCYACCSSGSCCNRCCCFSCTRDCKCNSYLRNATVYCT